MAQPPAFVLHSFVPLHFHLRIQISAGLSHVGLNLLSTWMNILVSAYLPKLLVKHQKQLP